MAPTTRCIRSASPNSCGPPAGAATSWAEVARTDLFPGYTVVRPILRQADFNGGLHLLYADVTGFATERNFARAVQTVLSNATWGLGKPVNAASLTAAAALLHANLLCDGAMVEQRQAQDWLSLLLMVRGMRIGTNAAGEWTITVDTQATTRFMLAQDGVVDGERTLLEAGPRGKPALEDRVKTLLIKYRRDLSGLTTGRDDLYRQTQSRVVNAATGHDKPYDHDFLRSHEAADRVADFLGKRLLYGQETVEVALTQEARQLTEGHIVALQDPTIGYEFPVDLEVQRVRKSLTRIEATLQGWNEAIYTYTPGTLPANEAGTSESENAQTAPAAPTTPSITASGTRIAGDGHVTAWVQLGWTNPTTNFSESRVRYRATGIGVWMVANIITTTGASVGFIEGLLPATNYDYSIQAVNAFGTLTADSPTLANQLSPTDASVPTAPTFVGVFQAGARVIEIDIGGATPLDWLATVLYRNTTTVIQQHRLIAFGLQEYVSR